MLIHSVRPYKIRGICMLLSFSLYKYQESLFKYAKMLAYEISGHFVKSLLSSNSFSCIYNKLMATNFSSYRLLALL